MSSTRRQGMLVLGWGWAAGIVAVSLMPAPPGLGVAHGDKIGHVLAYAVLMALFCALYARPRTRLAYAVGWTALGVALEFAQRATGYRTFELPDMAANAIGVLAGWLLVASIRAPIRSAPGR